MLSFDVAFELDARELDVEFNHDSQELMVEFENLHEITVVGDVEYYAGKYDVTPLITAQTLYTQNKMMNDNVRDDMIPTRELENAAGGVTFIVGG